MHDLWTATLRPSFVHGPTVRRATHDREIPMVEEQAGLRVQRLMAVVSAGASSKSKTLKFSTILSLRADWDGDDADCHSAPRHR
jgi:hypothetical protein